MKTRVRRPRCEACGNPETTDDLEATISLPVTLPCASPTCSPRGETVELLDGNLFRYVRYEITDGGEHVEWGWVRLMMARAA